MEAIDKLLKKPLWVNILTGIGAFIVLLILFFFSLGWITGNGKTEKVPNVVGLDVTAAQKNLTALGFDVVLQDSIYVDTLARNAVLRQTPASDEIVKKGRAVYLTINRIVAPLIDMPNLIGFSLKSAQTLLGLTVDMARAKIASMGLQLGNITSATSITDTANAFVIQQNPNPYSGQLDSLGMPIKNVTFQGGAIDVVIDKVAPVIKRDSIN
ncbi:MAG: PASTA domain-containing protein [Sediminibacterium sp.]|nr:PASTA domain-containing protein [Sediminibacterium sp.]